MRFEIHADNNARVEELLKIGGFADAGELVEDMIEERWTRLYQADIIRMAREGLDSGPANPTSAREIGNEMRRYITDHAGDSRQAS